MSASAPIPPNVQEVYVSLYLLAYVSRTDLLFQNCGPSKSNDVSRLQAFMPSRLIASGGHLELVPVWCFGGPIL